MLKQIMTGLLFALLMSVGLSWGQSYTVCPQGCPYSSIQEAINDAFPGDTITVGPGTYKEHLEIRERDLQLIGAGVGQVTLELVVESVNVGEERRGAGLLIANSAVTLKGFTFQGSGSLWFKNADVQLRENVFRGEARSYNECLICVEGGLEFIAEDNRFEDYDGSWTIDADLLKRGYALVRLRTDLAVLRRLWDSTHHNMNIREWFLVFLACGLVLACAPTSSPSALAQPDPATLVQQLIRQAWVIGPADLGFAPLRQELLTRAGLSGPALAAALQAGPFAPPRAVSSFTYWALLPAQGADLRQVAAQQVSYLLLGLVRGSPGTRLGGIALPQTFGVAAFASAVAFVLAVVDLSNGQVVAFVLLPASPVIAAPFSVSDLLLLHVLVGVIQSTPPVPSFPGALACPPLRVQFPFSVQVGSGLPLVTVTDAEGRMLFQVSDGGLGVLRLTSSGPALFSAVTTGSGATSVSLLVGAGSSAVRIPVGEPFRLLVTGAERTACVQGIVYSFGFGAVVLGMVAQN